MLWIPINKTTQTRYPAITDEQKKANDADELIRSKYRYEAVPGSDKQPAPAPVEAKKVEVNTQKD